MADHHGMDHQSVLVDQPLADQRVDERRAAVGEDDTGGCDKPPLAWSAAVPSPCRERREAVSRTPWLQIANVVTRSSSSPSTAWTAVQIPVRKRPGSTLDVLLFAFRRTPSGSSRRGLVSSLVTSTAL